MNRTQMAARLQNFFQNPAYYKSIDINDSLQDGLDEIAAFTGCIFKSATIPFTQNTTYYNMVNLIPDYIGVYAIFNAVIRRWMTPSSLRKFNQVRIDWETIGGTPFYFSPVSHRYLAIFRKPLVPAYGNMYVFYVASAPLLNDTTEIPIPDDHLSALESYSIQDLWEQNQEFSKAANYLETYSNNLESLRVYMQNKRNSDRQMSLR